ncbi:MAG: hypothetical protein FJ012_05975 [Chloroflexi bacterium]|nr:hypothetical protein [Chloroflexota bacterium]
MEYRWRLVTRGLVVLLLLVAVFLAVSCGNGNSTPSNNNHIVWQEVPWADGETAVYEVRDTGGNLLGEATFTAYKEGNAWVFRYDYSLILDQKPVTQQITVKVRGQDLKPISGSITGFAQDLELYSAYTDNGLTVTIKSPRGEEQTRTFDVGSFRDAYDNDEVMFLLRSLPLQIGYAFSYTGMVPISVVSTTMASWIVDTTGPIATLSGAPTGVVNYKTTDITVGGPNVVIFKYKLDSGDWSGEIPVSSHITFGNLTDGEHTLSVIGRDEAGNWQAESLAATAAWTVCTAGPIATLSGLPVGVVNYNTTDIMVGGEGVVAYKYQLNDGDWSGEIPVSTHIMRFGLADGQYALSVIAKDATDTWQSEDSATKAGWAVWTSGPLATLLGAPAALVNSTTADIAVGGPNVVTYMYKVDDGPWSDDLPAGTHISLSGLGDGRHTVYVVGKDVEGTWQANQLAMRTMLAKVMTTLQPIQTPQGLVWAYKVSLKDQVSGSGVYLWYHPDAPHHLLYYDDGQKVMRLVEHS